MKPAKLGQIMLFSTLALTVSCLSAGYAILSSEGAQAATGSKRYLPESPYAERRGVSVPESLRMDRQPNMRNDVPLMPTQPNYAPSMLQPAPVAVPQPVAPPPNYQPRMAMPPQPMPQPPVAEPVPQPIAQPFPTAMPAQPVMPPVAAQGTPVIAPPPSFALPKPPMATFEPMPQPPVNLQQQPLPVPQAPVLPDPEIAPVAAMPPVEDNVAPVQAPVNVTAAPLSDETRDVLKRVPKHIEKEVVEPTTKTELRRYDPEIEGILGMTPDGNNTNDVYSEERGVSIRVQQPSLNTEFELQKAYEAMTTGETYLAIEIYKDVLKQEPGNQDALFGIATAFHRTGELDWARAFYDKLLAINPRHTEGLNNLMVLVAQESPEEALLQLEKLLQTNPEFAPIHAQLGLLYHEMGDPKKAQYHLLRAVKLEPGNIDYSYNLAIILDEEGEAAEAVAVYNKLLQAARNGEQLPATPESIEERVIYLSNASRD